MTSTILPIASQWKPEDLGYLLKGKREQHHKHLAETGNHIEMNDDFVHGFATAMAFEELRQENIKPDDLAVRIAQWSDSVQEVLDHLDDVIDDEN